MGDWLKLGSVRDAGLCVAQHSNRYFESNDAASSVINSLSATEESTNESVVPAFEPLAEPKSDNTSLDGSKPGLSNTTLDHSAARLSVASPADSVCRIELPQFEGPLDLLLHLIAKHELDIIDIPIGFITEKYLEYLSLLTNMSIDIASEYLVMAATLAHIKSKMLLPVPPIEQEDGADNEAEDPRAELVRRLLEYQKYKAAAEELSVRTILGADVFTRGKLEQDVQERAPLEQSGIFALIDAFQRIAERRKIRLDHEIDFDRISITERIGEIAVRLQALSPCTLEELLSDQAGIGDLIITFLALLEMTRLRMTRLEQSRPLAPLHICLAVSQTEADVPERDSGDSNTPHSDSTTDRDE